MLQPIGNVQTYNILREKLFIPAVTVSFYQFHLSYECFRFVRGRGIHFVAPVQRERPAQAAHAHLWGSKQLSLAYTTQYAQYSGKLNAHHTRV